MAPTKLLPAILGNVGPATQRLGALLAEREDKEHLDIPDLFLRIGEAAEITAKLHYAYGACTNAQIAAFDVELIRERAWQAQSLLRVYLDMLSRRCNHQHTGYHDAQRPWYPVA